jgi:hypothetical protein
LAPRTAIRTTTEQGGNLMVSVHLTPAYIARVLDAARIPYDLINPVDVLGRARHDVHFAAGATADGVRAAVAALRAANVTCREVEAAETGEPRVRVGLLAEGYSALPSVLGAADLLLWELGFTRVYQGGEVNGYRLGHGDGEGRTVHVQAVDARGASGDAAARTEVGKPQVADAIAAAFAAEGWSVEPLAHKVFRVAPPEGAATH